MENTKALLSSVISGELGNMKSKFEFWQMPGTEAGTLWQAENNLKLEEVLAMIDPTDTDLKNSEMGVLLGIGWEFVWGAKPPEIVTELREIVRTKAKFALPMTEMELLWYRLICADTDMF